MKIILEFSTRFCTLAITLVFAANITLSAQDARPPDLKQVVEDAFIRTYDGWSSDEVILQDELNAKFIKACQERLPDVDVGTFNWALLNLRKSGKLSAKATKRDSRDYSSILHIAEMSARMMEDKYSISIDRMMCQPNYRREFEEVAKKILNDVDPYLVRKAAFRLRKTRRLQPELITRIADWDRQVTQHDAAELANSPAVVPAKPGIYIFRDHSGYLYIGEAANLRNRLSRHLDSSDRLSLAHYLKANDFSKITVEVHAFDPESRAREVMVRRAYESELIGSRKPKFNIRP